MGWELRSQGMYFDPFMVYELDSEYFSLRLHHGGRFSWGTYVQYENGEADYIDYCNVDRMSMLELNEMLKEVGHKDVIVIYYSLNPTKDLKDGLQEIFTDADFIRFCELGYKYKVLEVYCHHLNSEEIDKLEATIVVDPGELNKRSGVVIEEIDEEERIERGSVRTNNIRIKRKPKELGIGLGMNEKGKAKVVYEHQGEAKEDREGLDRALSDVLPNASHRYCVQHMYRNFKKKHPGLGLKDRFWKLASCTTIEEFEKVMSDFEAYNKEATQWIKQGPHPKHWCKAYFSRHTKCDMIVNNLCESFNAHILEAREEPIITMMESIRIYLMKCIQERKAAVAKNDAPIGPLIRKILDERVRQSVMWQPVWNSEDGYQVKGPRDLQYTVNLRKNQCSCNLWALCGIPCCHAIAALHRAQRDPYTCLDECYSRETFIKVYMNVLQPINGELLWPQSEMMDLDPPKCVVQPGRPKKAQKRDVMEGKDHGKRIRRRVVIHCKKCGGTEHNAATCKGQAGGSSQSSRSTSKPTKRKKSNPAPESTSTTPSQQTTQRGTRSQSMAQAPSNDTQNAASSTSTRQSASRGRGRGRGRGAGRGLSDADKGYINSNYAYLGKDPPFNVGNWKGRNGPCGRGRRGRRESASR